MATEPSIPDTVEDFLQEVENAVYRIATNPDSTNAEVLRAAIILFKRYEVGSFSRSKPEKPVRLPTLPPLGPVREPLPNPIYLKKNPFPMENPFQEIDDEMGLEPEDMDNNLTREALPTSQDADIPQDEVLPPSTPIPPEAPKLPAPRPPNNELTIQQIPIPPYFVVPQKNYFPSNPNNPFFRRALQKPKKPKTIVQVAAPDTS